MRQTISGLIAAIALVTAGAVPAMACGGPYGGCWGYERLPDPEQQYHHAYRGPKYYYVNQGPTFTGPGDIAPLPTYQESTVVSGREAYRRPYYRGPVLRRYY
jgi:hypothetical protein